MEMQTVYWISVALLLGIGIAGTVLPALPGLLAIFAGIWLAAWIDHYDKIGIYFLVAMAVVTILTMIVENVASVLGVKKVGASKYAIWGATLGSILGFFLGFWPMLFLPFVGAAIGEFWVNPDYRHATKAGLAAWLGMIFGMVLKIAVGFSMIGASILNYFLVN